VGGPGLEGCTSCEHKKRIVPQASFSLQKNLIPRRNILLRRIFNTIITINQPVVLSKMKIERNLENELKTQLKLLKALCDNYDNGIVDSVKCISVIWRLLFYDRQEKTESLLALLGIKEKVRMYDFSAPRVGFSFFNLGERISGLNIRHSSNIYCGLVCKDLKRDEDGKYIYSFSPLCSSPLYHDYEKSCKSQRNRKSISEWSDAIIYEVHGDNVNFSLSRAALLYILCNKDGGAHFDKTFTTRGRFDHKSIASYIAFRDDQALHLMVNGVDVRFVNDPAYPSVRQIAHEVLASLEEYM